MSGDLYVNNVSISGSGGETNTGNNDDVVTGSIVDTPVFDLALTKVLASAGPFAPGDEVTYTINIYNQGTVDATAVEVIDYVPNGMTFVPSTTNDFTLTGSVYTASLGTLAAQTSTTLSITLMIDEDFV